MNPATTPETSAAKRAPSYSALSIAVFGREPAMRVNIQRSVLSFSIYLIWMIVEAFCARQGWVDWRGVALMYGFNILGVGMFYTLMRSGLSRRFADPSMVLAQTIYASGALMIAYILIPQTRAAALQTLCITVIFGMFTLRPRETVIACAWTVLMLLATIALMLTLQTSRIDVQQEIINVSVACIVLPALTSITRHFALLREKLQAQRADIKEALNRTQELATRDSLTQLINRAHMQEILNKELARYQRQGTVFSLALIDIDHFKAINDKYGHQAGDEVLIGFAKRAAAMQRQIDVIARWGGEEFLILMPETPADGALNAIERLRAEIARQPVPAGAFELSVTISAGVTQSRPNEALNQILERADRALYAAKDAGRNKSVLAT